MISPVQSAIQIELFPIEDTIYTLIIESIPLNERVLPEWEYRLIHHETGLQVPGQFTKAQAEQIQKVTQQWDWSVDKKNKPACAAQLLQFLEQLCAPSCKKQEGQI
ncbi:hypothetical protein [Gloeothece verrucosa]|uniref:Uncharacterized protein n=1 Tax=Gloeothece verrucosa (strain PCC 7822) TaxID=497965 RepID=E0U8A8_GLOV7|nr:hypothetical protein [Gloeothece verrucosa]ADN12544.1 hypothetical protein Cyan7822_0502 [Gloeothece verrucosa PCC 7822]